MRTWISVLLCMAFQIEFPSSGHHHLYTDHLMIELSSLGDLVTRGQLLVHFCNTNARCVQWHKVGTVFFGIITIVLCFTAVLSSIRWTTICGAQLDDALKGTFPRIGVWGDWYPCFTAVVTPRGSLLLHSSYIIHQIRLHQLYFMWITSKQKPCF